VEHRGGVARAGPPPPLALLQGSRAPERERGDAAGQARPDLAIAGEEGERHSGEQHHKPRHDHAVSTFLGCGPDHL
jgi:hypothetical protein